jgi:DNA-binding NarL/FixJ family response regulator
MLWPEGSLRRRDFDMIQRHVRVLLADDHDVVRAGVRAILETRVGWRVCGEATSGAETLRLAAELRPDIAVIDLEMDGLDGVAVTRLIKEHQPQTDVLIRCTIRSPIRKLVSRIRLF